MNYFNEFLSSYKSSDLNKAANVIFNYINLNYSVGKDMPTSALRDASKIVSDLSKGVAKGFPLPSNEKEFDLMCKSIYLWFLHGGINPQEN